RLRIFVDRTLFNNKVDRIKILKTCILKRPSAELQKGFWWHIGNVKELDDNGASFAIGRTTKSKLEIYDPKTKDFIINEHPESPYTQVYIDFPFQIIAIAYKPKLSQYTKSIAQQLERILNLQDLFINQHATANIAALKDPKDFITHLKEAAVVQSFSAEFSLPNLFDSEEDFEKPFQRLIQESEGNKGKAIISGSNLNRAVIEDLARSCAASGNEASAKMKDTEQSRLRTRKLKRSTVILDYDEEDPTESPEEFLKAIRDTYNSIRSDQEND
ncbi:MAG: hypothetical protein PHG91_13470, partial [Syntrophales bacterium]|nr:hypothetical protein [Syntrophales bacterium]